jgi:hypothetical protein
VTYDLAPIVVIGSSQVDRLPSHGGASVLILDIDRPALQPTPSFDPMDLMPPDPFFRVEATIARIMSTSDVGGAPPHVGPRAVDLRSSACHLVPGWA